MNLQESLLAYLAADLDLTTILTGGLHAGLEITRQKTPAAFDGNGEVMPCVLVRDGVSGPVEPHPDGARGYVDMYFYQYQGSAQITSARLRVYQLLHRQNAGIAGVWEFRHVNDVAVTEDPALNCNLAMSQYMVYLNREVTG